MRPPIGGWPETRGSFLGADKERERARQRMGKTRNQKRTERNNRKARSGRRKHQQRLDEASRSKPMEQQSLPETKQRRTVKGKTLGVNHGRLVRIYDEHGLDELATFWAKNGYWSRCKGGLAARISAARKLIGLHVADAEWTSMAPVVQDFVRLIEHFDGARRAVPRNALVKPPTAPVDLNSLQQAIAPMIASAVATAVTEAIAKLGPSQLEERKAPVVPLRPRDQIVKLVRAASSNDGAYKINFDLLYATAQAEWRVEWGKVASGHRVDFDRPGWKLDAAEKTGCIGELLEIAKRLFAEQAANNKS